MNIGTVISDSLDRGTAKCRLPISFFETQVSNPVLFKIGEFALIYLKDSPDFVYLCSVWPSKFQNVSSVDRFISKIIHENAPIKKELAQNNQIQSLIFKMKSWNMFYASDNECATLETPQTAYEIKVRFIGESSKNSRTMTKILQISTLLDNLHVSTGSIISYDHITTSNPINGIEVLSVLTTKNDCKVNPNFPNTDLSESNQPCKVNSSTKINLLSLSDSIAFGVGKTSNFSFFNVQNSKSERFAESKTNTLLKNVGGLKNVTASLLEMIEIPLKYPEVFKNIGLACPRGILLYGAPGTGKSFLVKEISELIRSPLITVTASDIASPILGQSELLIRNIFDRAAQIQGTKSDYKQGGNITSGVIIFIDEIDSICGKRELGNFEARVVAQLLTCIENTQAVVIGATNRPQDLDTALRRPGRFDREIEIPLPNFEDRIDILKKCSKGFKLESCFYQDNFWDNYVSELASRTYGWSGADLVALLREATLHSIRKLNVLKNQISFKTNDFYLNHGVSAKDFEWSLEHLQPSSKRGWTTEVPKTTWDDIGGLEDVKKKLKMAVEWPLKHFLKFKHLGLELPRGILLHGPPGCSKTTLVRAIANSCQASFVSVSGADVYSPYVGESERFVRDIFKKAYSARPSIIFFDEIDSMVSKRESGETNNVSTRVLAQLLTEMDGINSSNSVSFQEHVLIIGATNRLDRIDNALLRPGRFDHIIEVPKPDFQTRVEILKVQTKKMPIFIENKTNYQNLSTPQSPSSDFTIDYQTDYHSVFDFEMIANRTEGFSGADLKNLCREAAMVALEKDINVKVLTNDDFIEATKKLTKKNIK